MFNFSRTLARLVLTHYCWQCPEKSNEEGRSTVESSIQRVLHQHVQTSHQCMNNGHVFTAKSSDFSMVTKQYLSLPDDNTNMLYTQFITCSIHRKMWEVCDFRFNGTTVLTFIFPATFTWYKQFRLLVIPHNVIL